MEADGGKGECDVSTEELGCALFVGRRLIRFSLGGAIGFSLDLDDDGAFNETIEESHSQWSIAHVIGPAVEVDVGE